ncbi:MAG TPA: glycosyl hydrolase family 79 C-terminal domain-containing protein [Phycisphaerae bacterium]|nr:glycosyl hydrolase family 79 C-terminal domain-containing protein [Phycisphaerae bacterium]
MKRSRLNNATDLAHIKTVLAVIFLLSLVSCTTGAAQTPMAQTAVVTAATSEKQSATQPVIQTVNISAAPDLSARTQPVPQSFLGISCEYNGIESYMSPQEGRQTATVELLNTLGAFNGPPVLRIGGNSEDHSVWDLPQINPKPKFARINITPTMADDLHDTIQRTHSKVILGVNLGADDPTIAESWVTEALNIFEPDSILAFEIGNEPDEYAKKEAMRSKPWDYPTYRADYEKFAVLIAPLLPRQHMLAGPAATGFLVPFVARFALDEQKYLGVVTVHKYPMGAPVKNPKAPNYASMENLLKDSSASGYAHIIAPVVAAARKTHVLVRFGEMNSAWGGGKPGLSSSFGSALWGLDTLFTIANTGADGVNFHMGASYAPFTFDYHGTLFVHPLYYGMLLFAMAVQNHARLIPVTFKTEANVKIWAALDDSGVLRVVVINKDLTANAIISLSIPGAGGGQITRLIAPSVNSQYDVTLGNITFDGSTNGLPMRIHGASENQESVLPTNGRYEFNVGHTSAAMLTVSLKQGS